MIKRTMTMIAAAAATALTAGAAMAAPAYEGTADDYAQINQLMQKYNYTLDNWDGPGWASVFTENGTFHFGRGCIAGRPALAALLAKMAPDYKSKPPQQHVATPGYITYLDRDHAWVHSSIMVIGSGGFVRPLVEAVGVDFTGAYDDTLQRVNGRWLIVDRTENTKTADYKPPGPCPAG